MEVPPRQGLCWLRLHEHDRAFDVVDIFAGGDSHDGFAIRLAVRETDREITQPSQGRYGGQSEAVARRR